MATSDFTTTVLVEQTPPKVFNAIKNIREWWSEEVEGFTDKVGDEFTYHYKDIHYCKLKLVELAPDQKLVWLVVDNYFKFTEDKAEWIGSKLVFDISRKDDQTEVRFTHQGLVPQYECYKVCREAWTHYIRTSLYKLITAGQGQPSRKEADGFDAELVKKWSLAR